MVVESGPHVGPGKTLAGRTVDNDVQRTERGDLLVGDGYNVAQVGNDRVVMPQHAARGRPKDEFRPLRPRSSPGAAMRRSSVGATE